jgi:hypothetical protein
LAPISNTDTAQAFPIPQSEQEDFDEVLQQYQKEHLSQEDKNQTVLL